MSGTVTLGTNSSEVGSYLSGAEQGVISAYLGSGVSWIRGTVTDCTLPTIRRISHAVLVVVDVKVYNKVGVGRFSPFLIATNLGAVVTEFAAQAFGENHPIARAGSFGEAAAVAGLVAFPASGIAAVQAVRAEVVEGVVAAGAGIGGLNGVDLGDDRERGALPEEGFDLAGALDLAPGAGGGSVDPMDSSVVLGGLKEASLERVEGREGSTKSGSSTVSMEGDDEELPSLEAKASSLKKAEGAGRGEEVAAGEEKRQLVGAVKVHPDAPGDGHVPAQAAVAGPKDGSGDRVEEKPLGVNDLSKGKAAQPQPQPQPVEAAVVPEEEQPASRKQSDEPEREEFDFYS